MSTCDFPPSAEPLPPEKSGTLRPSSPAASRDGRREPPFQNRTAKFPIVFLPDETWISLRRLAYQCAAFGNVLLSEQYAKAKGMKSEFTTYTDFRETLSAGIRDAVGREVVGFWRRLGRKVLRGEQTLGRFSVDRALVVRDRAVHLSEEKISLRLHPKGRDQTDFPLYSSAFKRDQFLKDLWGKLVAGEYPVTKATVQFERPGRKVFVRLSYRKPLLERQEKAENDASLVVDKEDFFLSTSGNRISYADWLYRMRSMKNHFSKIQTRLRMCLGKRGRRREHRRALAKRKGFLGWSEGPLHQISREIIKKCQNGQVGKLNCLFPANSSLPFDRLAQYLKYKGEELGIEVMKTLLPPEREEGLRIEFEEEDEKALNLKKKRGSRR